MSKVAKCPKCNSTQLSSNTKGYNVKNGIGGMVVFGGAGLLAGLFGKNELVITCLCCGHKCKQSNLITTDNIEVLDASATREIGYNNNHVKSQPPKVQGRKIKCECNTLNDLGSKFCRVCGIKIDYENITIEKNSQKYELSRCQHCDHNTPKPSRKCNYCTHCGKELK